MKKTIFIVITVATVIAFTACSKDVERPSGNRNEAITSVQNGSSSNAIKTGYIGPLHPGDSVKTKTMP